MSIPAIIVNFKTYDEVEGKRASDLALLCQEVAEESGASISVCPPMVELSMVASIVNIPVLSQHLDDKKPGSSTGWITPQMVKSTGAVGTLLNHSEHRLSKEEIGRSVSLCRSLGLQSIVCADSEASASEFAAFHPDFIAVEPPELIGGDISVTDARPEVVETSVRSVIRVDAKIPVLCGAGIKNGKDVSKALDLGASGVLLASGVVKSKNPRATLEDLISLI